MGLCVVFPFGEDAQNGKNLVQTMKFVLKQYDTALLTFDLRSEGLDGFACTLLEKEQRHRLDRNYNLLAQRLKTRRDFYSIEPNP